MSAPFTGIRRQLLPRSTPAAAGLSSRAVGRLLSRHGFHGKGAFGQHCVVTARLDASPAGSALPDGTEVIVEPNGNSWLLHLGPDLRIEIGHSTWRECSPLGRPVVASGAWQGANDAHERHRRHRAGRGNRWRSGRQARHWAVIAQFDHDRGAADILHATLAPFWSAWAEAV